MSRDPRRRSFQIHSLDTTSNIAALADQVAEVLLCYLALALYANLLLPLILQLFYIALQALA